MKIIENKIVFSNDIKKILNGNNPLQFKYFKSEVPSSVLTTIDELRLDFKQDTNNIFASNVEIITEDEMESFVNEIGNCLLYDMLSDSDIRKIAEIINCAIDNIADSDYLN